jgi:DNA mismatch repair ATPase MutS
MVPQLCEIFGRFYENKDTWMAALSVLTELDCLSALSICSSQQEGVWTRPVFEEYKGKYENASFIDLKEMRHPCVTLS